MSSWRPHPDTVERRGFILAPGRRYQLSRSSCYLMSATAACRGSGRMVSLRFFTTDMPDDSARDRTKTIMAISAIGEQSELAEADEGAAFECGIFVEVTGDLNSDPAIEVTSVNLAISWVERKNFVPSFDRLDCFLKEGWNEAACRKDTPLWSNYDQGQTFPEWDTSDITSSTSRGEGGAWPGDGGEGINDEDGPVIIDEEGSPVEEDIDIIESDAFVE